MLRREFLKWMGAAAGAMAGTSSLKLFAEDADLDAPYQDGKDPAYAWLNDRYGIATVRLTGVDRKRVVLPQRSLLTEFMSSEYEDEKRRFSKAVRPEWFGVLALWRPDYPKRPIINYAISSRAGFQFVAAPGREIVVMDGQLDVSQDDGQKRGRFEMDTMFSFVFTASPPSPERLPAPTGR